MTARWEMPVAAMLLVAVPAALTWDRHGTPAPAGDAVPVAVRPVAAMAVGRRLFGGGMDDPGVPDVAAGTPDAPVLVGVVGRLPDAAVALVRGADGRSRPVAVGTRTGGWRLDGVSADRAVFSRGGERVRVRIAPE